MHVLESLFITIWRQNREDPGSEGYPFPIGNPMCGRLHGAGRDSEDPGKLDGGRFGG